MPKHVSVTLTLNIGDEEPPTYQDHYAAVADKDISTLLNILNDAASSAARQINAELRFDTRWNTITWSLDRPSDHPKDTETEEESVA